MNNRYMPDAQITAFRAAERKVAEASRLLSAAVLDLVALAEPGSPAEAAMKKVVAVEEAVRGMPYHDLHPQAEWMGGPVETSETKYRWPHGVRAVGEGWGRPS